MNEQSQSQVVEEIDILDLVNGYPQGVRVGENPGPYLATEFIGLPGVGPEWFVNPSDLSRTAKQTLRQRSSYLEMILTNPGDIVAVLNARGKNAGLDERSLAESLRYLQKLFNYGDENKPYDSVRFVTSPRGIWIFFLEILHDDENIDPSPRKTIWCYQRAETMFARGRLTFGSALQLARDLVINGGPDYRRRLSPFF